MLLDESLDAVPQGWNCLNILVQTEYEAVLLAVVPHILERIVVDVTVKLNAWLYPPVPFELVHQWVTEKEARFEAAHVPIADRITIDDLLLCHLLSDLTGAVLIDEVWEGPMLLFNFAVVCLTRYQ